jgi:hypothetical protein
MADDFKYPTRTLTTENRQYTNVIWQAGKPPLDSELNLMGQLSSSNMAELITSQAHSGALISPTSCERDFVFNPLWSNYFKIKPFKALIKGHLVNVEELEVKLPPPPSSGTRGDFVFLEIWKSIISSDNSGDPLTNKPTSTTVYSNGNVAGSGVSDEMVDPQVGFETTKRVQVQYQVRVVSDIDLKYHPEGISSNLVKANGPVVGGTTATFTPVEGDSGLWVANVVNDLLAEDSIYAIPLAMVFRRNSAPYVAVSSSGGPNQNGAINRRPSITLANEASALTNPTLNAGFASTNTPFINIDDLAGSGLDDPDLFLAGDRFFVIGSGLGREVVKVSAVNPSTGVVTISERGVAGTQAKRHETGEPVSLFNGRPDGLYADQIHEKDLLDMRHAVTLGQWDYQSMLEGAVSDVLFGRMRSSYKQNSVNAYCKGVSYEEVSYLSATSANRVHQMDAPNGFRDTWSDAAVPQMGLTMYLDPNVATDVNGMSTTNLNVTDQTNWDLGPDLNPSAFLLDSGSTAPFKMGAVLFMSLDDTLDNLAYGLKGVDLESKGVRFIAPRDMDEDKAPPFTIEELGSSHGFFSYPEKAYNYEKPFIVLGRNRASEPFTIDVAGASKNDHNYTVIYKKNGSNAGLPSSSVNTTPNLFEEVIALELSSFPFGVNELGLMLRGNLYAVVYGDVDGTRKNNGTYKVISFGPYNQTVNYFLNTNEDAWVPSGTLFNYVILEPIDEAGTREGLFTDGLEMTVEFRSQQITVEDTEIAIAVTSNSSGSSRLYIEQDFQLGVSILYPPNAGATANNAENIHKVSLQAPNRDHFLRNAASDLDTTNANLIPLINGDINLPTQGHVSLWNRLPCSNFPIGIADSRKLGGAIVNGELDREMEVFKDEGSKTIVIRPYQRKQVILHQHQEVSALIPSVYDAGHAVDGGAFFLSDRLGAYVLPEALMPRFGRQDIPMHTRTSTSDAFMSGLNHIFVDRVSNTDSVFNIIGGVSNNGNQNVEPVLFDTNATYGEWALSLSGVNAIGVRKRFNGGTVGTREDAIYAPTTDFGTYLQGIELPPFFGVARIYGVYERNAYLTHIIGAGNTSAHDATRTNPLDAVVNGDCPNLLRTDTDRFTLFINKYGGNEDINDTTFNEAHTYVLTEHAIDISRAPGYSSNSVFSDFEYVVEAVVFGFANGFISSNRNVLVRSYNGAGTQRASDETSKVYIDSVIPFAPPAGTKIAISYQRGAYQGDPYHTKSVTLLEDSDSTIPYGRKSASDLEIGTRDQDTVELNNRRDFEVLASMDFYTTLGTGKIGGAIYPSTITDVGYAFYPTSRDMSNHPLQYPYVLTSAFTDKPDQGGFATLYMFTSSFAEFNGAYLSIRNSRGSFSYSINTTIQTTLEELIMDMQRALQLEGYTSYQHYGITPQDESFYGLVIQEPYATDNSSLGFSGYRSFALGRDIQLFEGVKEAPMAFKFYSASLTRSREEDLIGLTNRTEYVVDFSTPTRTNPANAGNGETPISMVGVTTRLPLGSMVRDTDFLCEDVLNDKSSFLFSRTGNLSTLSTSVPVSPNGQPYTRILGTAGDVIQLTSGDLSQVAPLAEATNLFSLTRGSGAVMGASGNVPGSPFSFLVASFAESLKPTLKGSVLACRAMLVRCGEESFNGQTLTRGDEVQLIILTHCIDGNTRSPDEVIQDSLVLGGIISPTGYGEGWSAADRYRIKGKPLVRGYNVLSVEDIDPAPYNKE